MSRSYETETRLATWNPVGLLGHLHADDDRSDDIRGGSILEPESFEPGPSARDTERILDGEASLRAKTVASEPETDAVLAYHLRMARKAENAGDPLEARCQEHLANDRRAELARKAVRR